MEPNSILTRVYKASAIVIVSVLLLICFLFHWPVLMMGVTLMASLVMSAPAAISLHLLLWLNQTAKLQRSFVWMLLMAAIPLMAFIPAWLLADFVPGKTGFLFLLGILSGYAGTLRHGISIAQFFNSDSDESA